MGYGLVWGGVAARARGLLEAQQRTRNGAAMGEVFGGSAGARGGIGRMGFAVLYPSYEGRGHWNENTGGRSLGLPRGYRAWDQKRVVRLTPTVRGSP
jgi:hypothetical protein